MARLQVLFVVFAGVVASSTSDTSKYSLKESSSDRWHGCANVSTDRTGADWKS